MCVSVLKSSVRTSQERTTVANQDDEGCKAEGRCAGTPLASVCFVCMFTRLARECMCSIMFLCLQVKYMCITHCVVHFNSPY